MVDQRSLVSPATNIQFSFSSVRVRVKHSLSHHKVMNESNFMSAVDTRKDGKAKGHLGLTLA